MNKNKVVMFKKSGNLSEDPLNVLLRSGARQLIAEAVEAELLEFLNQYEGKRVTLQVYLFLHSLVFKILLGVVSCGANQLTQPFSAS